MIHCVIVRPEQLPLSGDAAELVENEAYGLDSWSTLLLEMSMLSVLATTSKDKMMKPRLFDILYFLNWIVSKLIRIKREVKNKNHMRLFIHEWILRTEL